MAASNGQARQLCDDWEYRVKELLKEGYDPDWTDDEAFDPLYLAVVLKRYDIVDVLLKHGADPNLERGYYNRLYKAVSLNCYDITELLLKHGADPNFGGGVYSPLYNAVASQCYATTELLLKHRANPNLGRELCNPLYTAVFWQRYDIAELLLKSGADPNLAKESNNSLYKALSSQRYDIAELLLKYGADGNLAAGLRDAVTILGTVDYGRGLARCVRDRLHRALKLLLSYRNDPNCKCHNELDNPLYLAVYLDLPEAAVLLLSHGASPRTNQLVDGERTFPSCLELAMQNNRGQLAVELARNDAAADGESGDRLSTDSLLAQIQARGQQAAPLFTDLAFVNDFLKDVDATVLSAHVVDMKIWDCLETVLAFCISQRRARHPQRPVLIVRLLGDPGSGKTTLAESLAGDDRLTRRIRHLLFSDRRDASLPKRTKGIHCRVIDDCTVLVDTGGQRQFMPNHQRLLLPSGPRILNLFLVSLDAPPHVVRRGIRTWSHFCCCRNDRDAQSSTVFIGTRDDRATDWQRDVLRDEAAHVLSSLRDMLVLGDPAVVLADVRQSQSEGVRRIYALIQQHKSWVGQEVITGRDIPLFLDEIIEASQDKHVVSYKEFRSLLASAVFGVAAKMLSPDQKNKIEEAVEHAMDIQSELKALHKECKLFYFPDELIVLNPTWLMEDITGKLYSPRAFPQPHITCTRDGWVDLESLLKVLGTNTAVPREKSLEIALRLGMCLRIQNRVLVLPALEQTRTDRHWPPQGEGQRFYAGHRLYCATGVMLSAAVLPKLQMDLTVQFGNGGTFPLWRNGILVRQLTPGGTVECLVEAPAGQLHLNLITRGHDKQLVQDMHQHVLMEVKTTCDMLSPGSAMSVLMEKDVFSGDRLRQFDIDGQIDNSLEFLASEHLHDVTVYPPISTGTSSTGDPEPDPRLSHRLARTDHVFNEGTVEGRRRAWRCCSVLFKHRALFRRWMDAFGCARCLVQHNQVDMYLEDEVRHLAGCQHADVDLLLNNIAEMPDSVVLTLCDVALRDMPGHEQLYTTVQECPGYEFCELKATDVHSASTVTTA